MKTHKINIVALVAVCIIFVSSCTRDFDDLEPASFPSTAEVYIDGFSGGLNYFAFGDSKVTAFQVDEDLAYQGSSSMRFDVPNTNDPEGGYAGGAFFDEGGRNLSSYNALTFWVRATKAEAINEIGFGLLGESKYQVTLTNIPANTTWSKVIIPIPDPSKLTQEQGMLYFAEAADDGGGYSFWIDEVRFEKLGTIAHQKASIYNGIDEVIEAEAGGSITITNLNSTHNLSSGVDQSVSAAPAYFEFVSSNSSVATVNEIGQVSVLDSGSATITATLAGIEASGSLTVTSSVALTPDPAPVPNRSQDSVISMFSNAYEDVTIDVWNTFWLYSTALNFDVQVDGDDMIKYTNLNFVGIEFASEPIDASEMTHFHMDVWTPNTTDLPAAFKILLVDFGADGVFDGGDDSSHEITFTSPILKTENWISLDIPLSNFSGLTSRAHLAQMVLSGDLPTIFIDNVYFYQQETQMQNSPEEPAPVPTIAASDVISVYSDSYDNLMGTDFNPDWGQATVVNGIEIEGNTILLYNGLDYQGIQLADAVDISSMDFLHLDFWTANSSMLNTFLISDGPVEEAFSLAVPTSAWSGVDIPLSSFDPVDLANLIQLKFDGNGDVYLDNIYFYKEDVVATEPENAAPTPIHDEIDVLSIYSDSYMDVVGTNFNPDWGQATVVSQITVAGNNTQLYTGLNYQGIELAGSQDAGGMEFLHIDYWTINSTVLEVFLISPGPAETAYQLNVPTSGWGSIDIPLSEFNMTDLSDIFQFKFEGNGDIYLDNIYFHK